MVRDEISHPIFYLNARLIILIMLATFGFQLILASYDYWLNIVPQMEVSPIIASSWMMLSDLLYCLGALGLAGLAAAVFRSETVSRRDMKILAAIMLSFGSSKLMSRLYYDILTNSSMGPRFIRHVDIAMLVQCLWATVYFFIAFRIIAYKPVMAKSTFTLSSILCFSLIIRNFSVIIQGFPYTERASDKYLLATFTGFDSVFLVLTLWFLVDGYRGRWSIQTLLSEGYPGYLRIGILVYGLKVLLPMLILPFVYADSFIEEVLRRPVSVSSLVVEVLFGLSIILASRYPLTLDLKEAQAYVETLP